MPEFEAKRPYQKVGLELRNRLMKQEYRVGEKLPAERDIAQMLDVSRTLVREALIMLELEGLIEVRKGSGVYVINAPQSALMEDQFTGGDDIGPFEMLQARQLLESNIAEFAAMQATPNDILQMRQAVDRQIAELAQGEGSQDGDKEFHLSVARATQNSVLVEMLLESWQRRDQSPMWKQLHARVHNTNYQHKWLKDHSEILMALQRKDPAASKRAMWQHLENVKQKLFELSDVDDPHFDGYLFNSSPVVIEQKQ